MCKFTTCPSEVAKDIAKRYINERIVQSVISLKNTEGVFSGKYRSWTQIKLSAIIDAAIIFQDKS